MRIIEKWFRKQGSNLPPIDYKSIALPNELFRNMASAKRFELLTLALEVPCSIQLSYAETKKHYEKSI
jgi:hypothetical protein